jgi:hypothetical protein
MKSVHLFTVSGICFLVFALGAVPAHGQNYYVSFSGPVTSFDGAYPIPALNIGDQVTGFCNFNLSEVGGFGEVFAGDFETSLDGYIWSSTTDFYESVIDPVNIEQISVAQGGDLGNPPSSDLEGNMLVTWSLLSASGSGSVFFNRLIGSQSDDYTIDFDLDSFSVVPEPSSLGVLFPASLALLTFDRSTRRRRERQSQNLIVSRHKIILSTQVFLPTSYFPYS